MWACVCLHKSAYKCVPGAIKQTYPIACALQDMGGSSRIGQDCSGGVQQVGDFGCRTGAESQNWPNKLKCKLDRG